MQDTSGLFDSLFRHARCNAILLMNEAGVVRQINPAFTMAFGYGEEDIVGQHFHILFTEKDRELLKPDTELALVLNQGFANDNNYIVNKDGSTTWVNGESIASRNDEGDICIIKVVHNIHVQKLLEQLLMESHEFVESIFQSITSMGMLIMDTRLKVIKANTAFFKLFDLKEQSLEDVRMADLPHPFWQDAEVRQRIREMVITNDFFKHHSFILKDDAGDVKKLDICARPLDGPGIKAGSERRILLLIREE